MTNRSKMFSVDELLKQQQQQQQFVEGNNGEQVLPKGFDTSNITSSDSNGNGYYMGVNTSMMKYLSSAFGPVAAESTGNNFKIGNFNQKNHSLSRACAFLLFDFCFNR